MTKKCVYCDAEVPENRAMQICDRCGMATWGRKQWEHIKDTTDEARDKGDLCSTNMNPDFLDKKLIG